MPIGDKLSSLLESRKMRVSDLSRMTGVSATTIYSIIKRNNKKVNFSTIDKIADALGVPPEYFHDDVSYSAAPNTSLNDDAWQIRERLRRDPDYRLLFDAADKAAPEHLRAAAAMLKALEPKEEE